MPTIRTTKEGSAEREAGWPALIKFLINQEFIQLSPCEPMDGEAAYTVELTDHGHQVAIMLSYTLSSGRITEVLARVFQRGDEPMRIKESELPDNLETP